MSPVKTPISGGLFREHQHAIGGGPFSRSNSLNAAASRPTIESSSSNFDLQLAGQEVEHLV